MSGFGGDGGAAVQAGLSNPRGVAVDGVGNLYIADTGNHRIRKVDPTGVITTIEWKRLETPEAVAVDGVGNLYIADTGNHRIRKVDSTGTITTIAGTGVSGFGEDGGPAIQATLYYPRGVAVDSGGNLYVADTYNHRIRRVDLSGTITTIAGTGERSGFFSGDGRPAVQAEFFGPVDVAVDSAGNVYIADSNNNRIRKVDSTGTITTIAGTGERYFGGDGGPANQAWLSKPSGVAVDGGGNLYIADTGNNRIRKVDSTGTITTIAGTRGGRIDGTGGRQFRRGFTLPCALQWTAGKPLHCRYRQQSHSQGRFQRHDHNDCRNRRERVPAGTGGRRTRRGSTTPGALRWTAAGTSTLLITVTIAFARSIRPARSRRLQEQGSAILAVTGARRTKRGSANPVALRWTAAGTSTLPIPATIAFEG